MVCPSLHHFTPLRQVLREVIGRTHRIALGVGELTLDDLMVPRLKEFDIVRCSLTGTGQLWVDTPKLVTVFDFMGMDERSVCGDSLGTTHIGFMPSNWSLAFGQQCGLKRQLVQGNPSLGSRIFPVSLQAVHAFLIWCFSIR